MWFRCRHQSETRTLKFEPQSKVPQQAVSLRGLEAVKRAGLAAGECLHFHFLIRCSAFSGCSKLKQCDALDSSRCWWRWPCGLRPFRALRFVRRLRAATRRPAASPRSPRFTRRAARMEAQRHCPPAIQRESKPWLERTRGLSLCSTCLWPTLLRFGRGLSGPSRDRSRPPCCEPDRSPPLQKAKSIADGAEARGISRAENGPFTRFDSKLSQSSERLR